MNGKHRGADALVRTLAEAGVGRIFTLSGNHIMPVFDAALERGVKLIHTRHEASAVHMADAASRVSGEVGIALVTGGPGHANAVSALYTALMAEAPVVLLSGHAPNNEIGRGAFQEMRQDEMAAPVAKASWTCAGAHVIASDVARAIRFARSGRPGPVHLSLPTDALEGEASTREATAAAFAAQVVPLEASAAQKIVARLHLARRPMILAGPACLTRPGRSLLAALESACGVPVIGMESPRGVLDPSLGAFAQVLGHADCILLLGKRLDFTLRFGAAPTIAADCRFMQVDADEEELQRSRRALRDRLEVETHAEAFSALQELARRASGGAHTNDEWLAQVREAIAFRPSAWNNTTSTMKDRLHPVQALRPVQELLDREPGAVLVCDGGEFGQWAQACLTAPHRVINGVAGSIGSALPYAVGARAVTPDAPVVAVLGDGTFGFHAAEFDTAARYELPFVAVVGNDARWNAEYQIQLRDYGPERLVGCELRPTRYDQVAAAFGGHGEFVTGTDALRAALERASASKLPACVNVMIEGQAAPQVTR